MPPGVAAAGARALPHIASASRCAAPRRHAAARPPPACTTRRYFARLRAASGDGGDVASPEGSAASVVWDAAADIAAGLVAPDAGDDGEPSEDVDSALSAALAGVTSAATARAALEGPGGPGLDVVLQRLSETTRVPEALLPGLLRLPSTSGSYDAVQEGARGLMTWRNSLQRGLLPSVDVEWPRDAVFREALLGAMGTLDMARFTRRHPALLDTLLANVLDVLASYEAQRQEVAGPEGAAGDEERDKGEAQPQDGGGPGSAGADEGEQQKQQEGDGGGGGGGAGAAEGEGAGGAAAAEAAAEAAEFSIDSSDDGGTADPAIDAAREAAAAANAELAAKLADEFKRAWDPLIDKLDAAAKAFDGFDLDDLSDGERGFDASDGVWHATGWRELDSLRRKLERLKELRELVRNLGRGGGRGPLRRAPRQEAARAAPDGVVRSSVAPEETRGLCRSDDLGRMLPSEATLLALSKPSPDGHRPALPAARLLHFARRAERTLLSYERVGWSDEPAQTRRGMEVRPAAECGPILLCLDTSGSMMGARETVAKALALECMRQARAQRRGCYVYAFSGPGQCSEFQLALTPRGMEDMLAFLSGSFHGGTDVDEPLRRCLARAQEAEWRDADILLVTDGEIPPPDAALLTALAAAETDAGMKVHGLLVGDAGGDAVKALCSHVTTFRAWDNVKD